LIERRCAQVRKWLVGIDSDCLIIPKAAARHVAAALLAALAAAFKQSQQSIGGRCNITGLTGSKIKLPSLEGLQGLVSGKTSSCQALDFARIEPEIIL
jgi:hypothetical protein